jgi:hypothetical protein
MSQRLSIALSSFSSSLERSDKLFCGMLRAFLRLNCTSVPCSAIDNLLRRVRSCGSNTPGVWEVCK